MRALAAAESRRCAGSVRRARRADARASHSMVPATRYLLPPPLYSRRAQCDEVPSVNRTLYPTEQE